MPIPGMPPPAGSAAPRLSHEASLLEAAPEPLSISAPLRDQAGESDGAGWTGLGERLIPLSGLALALFLVAHLALVALPLVDPDAFEALASALHRQLWLPVFEVLLAAALLLHPLLALQRSVRHRAARGPVAGPLRSRRGGGLEGAAALAGRWAPWSGAVLLVFLVVHLLQLDRKSTRLNSSHSSVSRMPSSA